MEKIRMHSINKVDENVEKIGYLFPNCVTEAQVDGKLTRVVDFDLLKQELSSFVVEGNEERYQFTWPDKKKSILLANAPIAKTLRPCSDESVDFDNTENLYIEGDNLEALKLLQETYLGKVKMIYIDPPYNTGRDFIYDDNFSRNASDYLPNSGQYDENGNRLVQNPESNGRFHTDWLNMMYARLRVSKDLLSEEGVIFISIGDEEVENLKKICNEVFGEFNFLETLVWIKKTAPNNVIVGSVHEYVLIYAKSLDKIKLYLQPRSESDNKKYSNPDNDPRGPWMADNITSPAKGGRSTPSLIYELVNPYTGEKHLPPNGRMWSVPKSEMMKKINEGTVVWGKNNNGRPMNKRFLYETRDGVTMQTLITDGGSNSNAAKEIQSLFNNEVVFETPKPTTLLKKLLRLSSNESDLNP